MELSNTMLILIKEDFVELSLYSHVYWETMLILIKDFVELSLYSHVYWETLYETNSIIESRAFYLIRSQLGEFLAQIFGIKQALHDFPITNNI